MAQSFCGKFNVDSNMVHVMSMIFGISFQLILLEDLEASSRTSLHLWDHSSHRSRLSLASDIIVHFTFLN